MKNNYKVRFWNIYGVNVEVYGKHVHNYDTLADAWDAVHAMLDSARRHEAVVMDINDFFYPIVAN